jgi:RNA polymerase sigma-70 factor, ECF subfamily
METDHALLNAARRMDEEALVKIFDLYSSALFNYALRLCGDPVRADHIVGDVFSKLLDQIAAGNGPTSNVRSYLYEMAYHQIVDEARRSRRRVPLEVADSVGQDTRSAFSRLEDEITFKQILHLLQTELTVDQRHVIVLRFLEEFSIRETAAIMGKTVEHVKVIQNRAIVALRRSIERGEVRRARSSAGVRGLSKAFGIW